jgi:NADH dehydrogenase
MIERLKPILGTGQVILADHSDHIGSNLGSEASAVVEESLSQLGIQSLTNLRIAELDGQGATANDGKRIEAMTVIWTAGMRANALANSLAQQTDCEIDSLGRIFTNQFLQLPKSPHIFAAGDCATFKIDGQHFSVMSCQHARPMGRYAGHNVVAQLFNLPMLPLQIPDYVTIVDLGDYGAVYTEGWQRHVISKGAAAKETKREINCQRIYPPLTGNRADLLAAAAPVVQARPALFDS